MTVESQQKQNPASRPIVCAVCRHRPMFKCSRCKRTFYCSRLHQKEHWAVHKQRCQQPRQVVVPNKKKGIAPSDCFANAAKLSDDELKKFVATALSKSGLCVLDDFCPEAFARAVNKECQAMLIESDMEVNPDISETLLTSADLKMCERIGELCMTLEGLVKKPMAETQLDCRVVVDRMLSKKLTPRNEVQMRLLHCSYFAKESSRFSSDFVRYYVENKVIDVETKYNRVVLSWLDGRLDAVNEKFSSNNYVVSSIFKASEETVIYKIPDGTD